MRILNLIVTLFLAIALVSTGVLATHVHDSSESFNTQEFVTLERVEVNNVLADEFSPVFLERGEQVVVEVFFTGNPFGKCDSGDDNPCYDTRVEAEIEGYEFGDVRDVVGPFEVEPGVSYRKVLTFVLPEDMPASDDLDLNIEVKDDDDLVLVRFPVRIQEPRHSLSVFDVIFNPTNNVRAGQPLFTSVRVENLGDNVEPSIKVTVAIPELGIQTSEFVDRLLTQQDQNDDEDEDGDDAATTNDLLLMIPEDAEEGAYDVVVTLEFNRGHSTSERTFTMNVLASEDEAATVLGVVSTGVSVSVDSQAQRVNQGQGGVFKFSVANLGNRAASFTFDVTGTEDWANTRVDPTSLVVQPDSTGDAFVYVAPKEGVEGMQMFTVKVMSGENVVAEKQLSLEVVKVPAKTSAKTVFAWVFVALLVILVILVIVVLVKRAGAKEESVEGQTYY